MWKTIILAILTSKPVRRMGAKIIEAGVRSTKTTLDDEIAAPILRYLRG